MAGIEAPVLSLTDGTEDIFGGIRFVRELCLYSDIDGRTLADKTKYRTDLVKTECQMTLLRQDEAAIGGLGNGAILWRSSEVSCTPWIEL